MSGVLANLRALVERARKYGIGVYLYMNEPWAMPTAFFKDRPEMGGVRDVRDTKGEYTALCTSQPAVRRWMGDALAYVFRQVPDLAGSLFDNRVGKPHQLRFSWRLALLHPLQGTQ